MATTPPQKGQMNKPAQPPPQRPGNPGQQQKPGMPQGKPGQNPGGKR